MAIILINDELQVKETIPNRDFDHIKSKTFLDVARWLASKYRDSIGGILGNSLGGFEGAGSNLERAPIKFEVMANDGQFTSVPYSDNVGEWEGKTDQIYFVLEPTGGANNPIFNKHSFGVIRNTRFLNWKPLIANSVADGIYAVGRVQGENFARTIRVQPSADYPNTPPIISSNPPFSNDPCWDTRGILHYTTYADGSGSPWNSLVARHQNPLISIIDELLTKYRMSV